MNLFRRIIGMEPTNMALRLLRGTFVCTGHVTRTERRSRVAMVAAFESHACEILRMLQDPALLLTVTRILLSSNHRGPDSQNMYLSACSYFHCALDWPK
jgi:hypothetical protein